MPSSRHLHCQRPFGNATRYPFGSPTNVILKLSPSHLLPQPRRTHLQRGNAPRPRAKPQRASNANNTTSILTRQLTLRRPPCPPKTPSSKSNGNPPLIPIPPPKLTPLPSQRRPNPTAHHPPPLHLLPAHPLPRHERLLPGTRLRALRPRIRPLLARRRPV